MIAKRFMRFFGSSYSLGEGVLIYYNILPLIIFVFFEVNYVHTHGLIRTLITLSEYLFLIICVYKDKQVGIMYYVSFTILSFGLGNYLQENVIPNSFWGMRLFGFSLNILFSFLLTGILMFSEKFVVKRPEMRNVGFILFYIAYCFFQGLFSLIANKVFIDNFFEDFMTYFPFFIYIYLLSWLDRELIVILIKKITVATVFMMFLSILLKSFMQYGIGNYFTLENYFSFIILPSLIVAGNGIDIGKRFFYIVLVLTMILFGFTFVGGKQIVLFVLTIFILLFRVNYVIALLCIVFSLVLINESSVILNYLAEYFQGSVLSFKFSQISIVLTNFELKYVVNQHTSIGNIFAESVSILSMARDDLFSFIFGKGLGGGIQDINGLLAPWAGRSGYDYVDMLRNNYHKMHLPLLEVQVKSGVFGSMFFLYTVMKGLFSKNRYMIVSTLLLFTVFYVSKEYLLVYLLYTKVHE